MGTTGQGQGEAEAEAGELGAADAGRRALSWVKASAWLRGIPEVATRPPVRSEFKKMPNWKRDESVQENGTCGVA
jgi:hypothetical protein